METNYIIIGLVLTAVIVLIIWLIRRNQKDRKDFERTVNQSELNLKKHKEDDI
ncbi:FeoB-associated Cys-rich membrane protein [Parapedobacter tibetensis]|uniref:FeoB-associated Cys-rich membrane protein n=1 Tax=Parapedobacter tibetensis TaxID=2972951 RepID=UPI00214DE1DC|nr:FeoB-associated Cys-rich membrane protein [Parapedobacter tibetensis]